MPGEVATRYTLVRLRHESGIDCECQRMRAFSDTKVGPLHFANTVSLRIIHSSDLSEANLVEIAHALHAAHISKSKLTMSHATDDETQGKELHGMRVDQ